jgi:putative colanic acid biosynthesis glycosyltransferase
MISKPASNNARQLSVVLSIITVVRNDEARLSKTIQSLEKIYGDERFEHIIVNGLSTDGTTNVLKKVAHLANLKVVSGPDSGIYDAMNKGSNLSSGNFVLFLNCGDELLALPEQIAKWCNEINPSLVDIACFSCALQFEDKRVNFIPRRHTKYKMPTSHQAMIFSRNFIAIQPYNTQYKIAGDFDLYLRSCPRRVLLDSSNKPLTLVQGEGYASSNPFTAYREYLKIAIENYQGVTCIFALTSIFCKGLIVIFLKKNLPMKWINYLRGGLAK